MNQSVLAFDFGASGGRAMLGTLNGGKLSVREIHRFSNDPEMICGHYYWDTVRLYHEIKTGLMKAKEFGPYESVGVDTWGVDYGLLDKDDRLMGCMFHYRDSRCEEAAKEVLKQIPMERLYEKTGIQFAPFNTIFQLWADQSAQPYLLEHSDKLLLLPDLFNYFLSGSAHTDYSHASTTGLLDVRTGDWSWELIDALGYPRKIFQPVSPSGQVTGALRPDLCQELLIEPAKVVSVASHDTASAVAAVPTMEPDTVYISCGTWSLFGTELDEPNTSAEALAYNFTNEGGYGGKIRFLKNIMGMWLIQQSRRHWNKMGLNLSYDDLEQLAGECTPFQSFVDVEDQVFAPPGDIPSRVQNYCRETGQPVPETVGEIMRCLYDSIALKYRYTFDALKELTGKDYTAIHMVGGGIKDQLICRLTADVCGVKVVAGLVEATVIGNIMVQFIANGAVKDIAAAREIIRNSFEVHTYEPKEDSPACRMAYLQYQKIIRKG